MSEREPFPSIENLPSITDIPIEWAMIFEDDGPKLIAERGKDGNAFKTATVTIYEDEDGQWSGCLCDDVSGAVIDSIEGLQITQFQAMAWGSAALLAWCKEDD